MLSAGTPARSTSRALWAARLVVLAAFLDLFAGFPVVAPFARDLGASPALVGVIVAAYSLANLVGNLGAGPVLDRWGRRRSLVVGLLGSAVIVALHALVRDPIQLLVLRALHGFATAVLSPGAFALIGDAAPPEKRARAMGSAGVFIAVTAVVAPPLAGVGRDRFGAPTVFVVVALVMLAVLATLLLLTRGVDTDPEVREVPGGGRRLALLLRPTLLLGYLGVLSLTIGIGTLIEHLPLVLVERGEGARASGYAFSVYALVALVGMAGPAARLADRYGRQRPLAGGLACIGVALLALSLAGSMPAVYATMALFGLGFGALFPAATALVADASAPSERGTAFGIFYAVYSLGTVIGSLASGVLADALGSANGAPFLLGGATALAAAPLVLLRVAGTQVTGVGPRVAGVLARDRSPVTRDP